MKWNEPHLGERLEPLADPEELLEPEGGQERLVRGLDLRDRDLSGLRWEGMRFQGCRFAGASLEGTECVDTVFEDCDLSNCGWSRGYLCRCALRGGKGVGLELVSAGLAWVTVEDGPFRYSNWNNAKLDRVRLVRCDLSEALMSQMTLKHAEFQACRLAGTSFFKTMLAGQDFTTCTLEGLTVSDTAEELRGLTVRTDQAADLARLLGLHVI